MLLCLMRLSIASLFRYDGAPDHWGLCKCQGVLADRLWIKGLPDIQAFVYSWWRLR